MLYLMFIYAFMHSAAGGDILTNFLTHSGHLFTRLHLYLHTQTTSGANSTDAQAERDTHRARDSHHITSHLHHTPQRSRRAQTPPPPPPHRRSASPCIRALACSRGVYATHARRNQHHTTVATSHKRAAAALFACAFSVRWRDVATTRFFGRHGVEMKNRDAATFKYRHVGKWQHTLNLNAGQVPWREIWCVIWGQHFPFTILNRLHLNILLPYLTLFCTHLGANCILMCYTKME